MERFNTTDKQIAHIAPGNILTFKNRRQFPIKSVTHIEGTDKIKLDAMFQQSMEFSSMKELIGEVDWKWMEQNCIFKKY